MLRQIRLCRVDAVRFFGCRTAVIQRHFLRACSSHQSVLPDPPAAVAKDPRWVMLNLHGRRMDDSFVADAKTIAESGTRFQGQHRLRVALGGAAPPASSFLYYDFPHSVPGDDEDEDYDDNSSVDVVAAHTDSVLLWVWGRSAAKIDYFVYRAGSTGPPSLSLLPDRDFLTKTESKSVYARSDRMSSGSTGLLRRGDNDLLVVQLDLMYNGDAQKHMAEFCLLRHGTTMGQWELREPVPILQDDDNKGVHMLHDNDVIPVGDRYLCWVDYEYGIGFMLCDMADDARPQVRYLPLPIEKNGRRSYDYDQDGYHNPVKCSMKMGSAGDNKVRFVCIDPRCCCGGLLPGRRTWDPSTCARSRYAFTVTTWTMDLSMDVESPLTWVKDGEMDCEEVWALPGYEGLPRANLECPIVSLDDPNVVCFLVSNFDFRDDPYDDWKLWMIQLNMKTKTLLSVIQLSNDAETEYHHLPAQLLQY